MSNVIPDGWILKSVGELSNVKRGASPRPIKDSKWWGGDIGWVRISDVTSSRKYLSKTTQYLSNEGVEKSVQIPKGEVVLSICATIGRPIIINIDACIHDGFVWFDKLNKNIFREYWYYFLASKEEFLGSQRQSGTQGNLNTSIVADLICPLPPLPEQQKIAAILSSVDEVIEKTQAQINKLKDLKTGMMQELLSPREGQAANINNPQGESKNSLHHIEFKDSPLGRIPVGWDCQLLDKVAKRGSGHTPDKKKPEYWNDGVKWVSLTDSSKLDQLYISNTAKNVSALGIENSSAVLHPAGTVVMTRDAGIGKSAITTDVMAVSQHLIAWMCGEKLDNYFLYYILQLWKPQFEAIAMGSTIKTIGLPYFKQLKVPVPPIDEQKNIANSLKSVDHKVFSLEKKNSQNIAIKKALMQDLLTGKKRVKLR
jgi:type I restriction enzyme, S subunit